MRLSIGNRNNESQLPIIISLFFFLLGVPFLNMSLVLTYAAILGLIITVGNLLNRKYYIDKYLLIVFFFYMLGEVLALFKCPDMGRTIRYTIEKFLVVLVLYPVMMSTLDSKEKRNQACELFKIGTMISAIFVWISYFTNIRINFISTAYQTQRLIFADYGPNVIARLFCVGALIALYEAQTTNARRRVINYLEYLVISFAAITTISMAGLLLLLLGSIIVFACFNEGVRRFGILKFIVVVAAVIVVGFIAYQKIDFVKVNIDKYLYRALMNQDDISNGRLEVLKGFENHLMKYWLSGIGYACSNYVVGRTIHFPIIAATIETGIFGFISVCYQYGHIVAIDFKTLRCKSRFNFFSIISLLIVLGDMVQPNPNYLFTWFAVLLGALPIMESYSDNEISQI